MDALLIFLRNVASFTGIDGSVCVCVNTKVFCCTFDKLSTIMLWFCCFISEGYYVKEIVI